MIITDFTINKSLQNSIDKLTKYLKYENANEVSFNEPKKVYILQKNKWIEIEDESLSFHLLNDFCIELARNRGMDFNEKNPILSTEIPFPYERYRVQAWHSSILHKSNIALSIRIPSKTIFELQDFHLSQKLQSIKFDFQELIDIVKAGQKNILISGETGSGKTSLLNSLMKHIDKNERLITIENAQELFIENNNKTQILTKSTKLTNFNYEDAINSAVRGNPDRILVGEIDTQNTLAFLRINNTGHTGNISTIHANNPIEAINAIITNIYIAGRNIEKNILISFIRSAIHLIIQIKLDREKGRVIDDIIEVKDFLSDSSIVKAVKDWQ